MRSCVLGAMLMLRLLSAEQAVAAFDRQLWGGAALATGGTQLAGNDVWTALSNPACAPPAARVAFSACLHPGAYGLVELRRTGAAGLLSLGEGTIILGATLYGFELYRETALSVGGALPLAGPLRLGAVVRWQHVTIAGYGSGAALSLDAGIRVALGEALAATASGSNLIAAPPGQSGERPLPELRLGMAASAGSHLRAALECEGNPEYPLGVIAAVEYRPVPAASLRCSVSTVPAEFGCGLGVTAAGITVDYGATVHALLGTTHAFSLTVTAG